MTAEKLQRGAARLTLHHTAPEMAPGLRTMAVSHIAFPDAENGTRLLRHAMDTARSKGAQPLVGPMEGDTWHAYRLVTETDGTAFDAAGFGAIGRYLSARVPLEGQTATDPAPLRVETWDGSDPEALFAQVHALSTAAVADNPVYLPIPLDAALAIHMPVGPLPKPDLVLFARDDGGALAGFLFGIPDYAEGPAPKTAILKTCASLRRVGGHALGSRFPANARALGHTHAIHALMHDDNTFASRSGTEGAQVFHRYALMGRRLDG